MKIISLFLVNSFTEGLNGEEVVTDLVLDSLVCRIDFVDKVILPLKLCRLLKVSSLHLLRVFQYHIHFLHSVLIVAPDLVAQAIQHCTDDRPSGSVGTTDADCFLQLRSERADGRLDLILSARSLGSQVSLLRNDPIETVKFLTEVPFDHSAGLHVRSSDRVFKLFLEAERVDLLLCVFSQFLVDAVFKVE